MTFEETIGFTTDLHFESRPYKPRKRPCVRHAALAPATSCETPSAQSCFMESHAGSPPTTFGSIMMLHNALFNQVAELEFRDGVPRSAPLTEGQARQYREAGFDVRPVFELVTPGRIEKVGPWIVTNNGGRLALRSPNCVLTLSGEFANNEDFAVGLASVLNSGA